MVKMNLVKATQADLDSIQNLLTLVNLPFEGVKEHISNFFVYKDKQSNSVNGCIGLELYSRYALLRSAAVHPENQGQGIGKKLTEKIISHAIEIGVEKIFLITNTAENYFKKKGFTIIPMSKVPEEVKRSVEFTFQCAKTGVVMTLDIENKKVPLIGRISMGLTSFDVSHLKDSQVIEGMYVDLIGQYNTIDKVAKWADTINYEILTNLHCQNIIYIGDK